MGADINMHHQSLLLTRYSNIVLSYELVLEVKLGQLRWVLDR
jgi:hypothetical protein